MPGAPVTEHDRAEVRRLHAEGCARNEIARRIGRSGRTVSRIAAELGLSFDRALTVAATEAKKADAKALRAEEMMAALRDARRVREQLFAPAKIMNFGGRDNTYNERDIPEPTFEQKRSIAQTWGLLIERSIRLDQHDGGDQGLAAVDAWLRGMMGGD